MINGKYFTIKVGCSAEIRVKGSRFIGRAFPVATPEEALSLIKALTREYHHASHRPCAYWLGAGEGRVLRYHDDGEPSGTAGIPILQAIERRHLTNTLVIVIRYFGGTKLGKGGLVRAYHRCAAATLEQCSLHPMKILEGVRVRFDHPYVSRVQGLVSRFGGEVNEIQQDRRVSMLVAIPPEKKTELKEMLMNLCRGAVEWEPGKRFDI
ncbi:YigZ family protein [candidate division KSB1 bacterium]|nr:YigZ family protein [candidate division KSB1 bacterium]